MYAHEIGRMPAEPQGAAETGPGPLSGPAARRERVVREVRAQVRAHRHRADARAAAAVRDAERLVQVQVRDVGAEAARLGEADERVHVRAVDVHLAAGLVHQVADLADGRLVHAVRRGVRDHQRRDALAVLGELRAQVVHVDVAVRRRSPTTATRMPAITALAAFVPCADAGIRQMSRPLSPRARW